MKEKINDTILEINNFVFSMKELYITRIEAPSILSLTEAEYLLENNAVAHLIQIANWDTFTYIPNVSFRIAHTDNHILLKYSVKEKHIRAMASNLNGNVYQDSCVEFFISFDGEYYYNMEFNCIGIAFMAFGLDRFRRKMIEPNVLEQIATYSTLGNQPFATRTGDFEWELMLSIPKTTFVFSDISSFNQIKATANFYKCGDATPQPHYLSWSPIDTPRPDFHQPKFFGKVLFG